MDGDEGDFTWRREQNAITRERRVRAAGASALALSCLVIGLLLGRISAPRGPLQAPLIAAEHPGAKVQLGEQAPPLPDLALSTPDAQAREDIGKAPSERRTVRLLNPGSTEEGSQQGEARFRKAPAKTGMPAKASGEAPLATTETPPPIPITALCGILYLVSSALSS